MRYLLLFLVACNAPIAPATREAKPRETIVVVRAPLSSRIVNGSEMRATSDARAYSYALCEDDELVLSGGCELGGMPVFVDGPSLRSDDATQAASSEAGGWYCEAGPGDGNVQAYAICAK